MGIKFGSYINIDSAYKKESISLFKCALESFDVIQELGEK